MGNHIERRSNQTTFIFKKINNFHLIEYRPFVYVSSVRVRKSVSDFPLSVTVETLYVLENEL